MPHAVPTASSFKTDVGRPSTAENLSINGAQSTHSTSKTRSTRFIEHISQGLTRQKSGSRSRPNLHQLATSNSNLALPKGRPILPPINTGMNLAWPENPLLKKARKDVAETQVQIQILEKRLAETQQEITKISDERAVLLAILEDLMERKSPYQRPETRPKRRTGQGQFYSARMGAQLVNESSDSGSDNGQAVEEVESSTSEGDETVKEE